MATGTIVHNFAGETNIIIIVPHKTTAPLADVVCTIDGVAAQTRKVYNPAHGQKSMLVEGLEPVWYFFTAYRSADGAALTQQINVIAFNAATGAQYGITEYEYQVDRGEAGDPVSGQRELRDPRLLNQKYWIEERMTGTLAQGEYTLVPDPGGFDLNDRDFNPETYYFVRVLNKSDVPESVSTGGGTPGVILITEDTLFAPLTHNGMLLVANAAGATLVLTFPSFATLANCSFKVNAQRGNQNYFSMQLDGGDTVWLNGEEVNAFHFGKGDTGEIAIVGNAMYLLKTPDRYTKLGDITFHEKPTKAGALLMDGDEYTEAEWPGAVELMESLEPSAIVNYTQRETDVVVGSINYGKVNYLKWARNGSGLFKTPDRRDTFTKALKNVDGSLDAGRVTQGSGGFQPDTIGDIKGATVNAGSSSHSSGSSGLNGQEVRLLVNTPDGGDVQLLDFEIITNTDTKPKSASEYLFINV